MTERMQIEKMTARILAKQYHNGLKDGLDNKHIKYAKSFEQYYLQSGTNWIDAARGVINLVNKRKQATESK